MPVTFKRTSNAEKRQRKIEEKAKIAESLARKPTIEATCTATTATRFGKSARKKDGSQGYRRKLRSRTEGQNITIYRTWRARGRKLGVSGAEVRIVIRATAEEREAAKTQPGGLAAWAHATARLLVGAIKQHIHEERLIDTGQLLQSITYKTKNI